MFGRLVGAVVNAPDLRAVDLCYQVRRQMRDRRNDDGGLIRQEVPPMRVLLPQEPI